MALPSGLAAQVGMKAETTWGTPVTVDRFVPLVSESLTVKVDHLVSEGIIAGRTIVDTDQVKSGNVEVSGELAFEAYEQSIGQLLYHALGSVSSTTASAPYTHTITPGDIANLGLTVQVGKPDTGGTVRPFTYSGCKVDSLNLKVAAGEIATLGVGVMARTVVTNTSLETASFATQAATPFTGIQATTTTWGGGALNVRSFELSIENHLEDRRFLGSAYTSEYKRTARRDVSGSAEVEFESLALFNDFIALTHNDFIVTMTNGTESLGVTMHARIEEFPVEVKDKGLVVVEVPLVAAGDGSDADALTIAYTCDDTSVTN